MRVSSAGWQSKRLPRPTDRQNSSVIGFSYAARPTLGIAVVERVLIDTCVIGLESLRFLRGIAWSEKGRAK